MTRIPYGWLAYAATNTAVGSALGAGFGPLDGVAAYTVAGAIALGMGVKTLTDLNSAYGPLVAVATPALATVLGLLTEPNGAPAACSVALFALAHSARKVRSS